MKTALFALLWFVGLIIAILGVAALVATVDIALHTSHPFKDWQFWSDLGCVLLAHLGIAADVYCGKVVQRMKL